jgi:hypothetical protein
MTLQLDIDFSKRKENNPGSQSILESNRKHFNSQCRKVYEAFMRGERLTTSEALIKYSIGDLRRRVKDLRDAGIQIEDEVQGNRFKIYFIKKSA